MKKKNIIRGAIYENRRHRGIRYMGIAILSPNRKTSHPDLVVLNGNWTGKTVNWSNKEFIAAFYLSKNQ